MQLAFAGTPEFAARALSALLAAGHEVVLVLTQPDRPAGRGLKLQASAVKKVALAHRLPLAQPRGLRLDGKYPADAAAARDALVVAAPECIVVAAYGLILPPWMLALAPRGCVNIHASLLPRWRGAAPIQRAIEAGDGQTGITLMQMDAGLDTGDILLQHAIAIAPDDNAASLHDRLAALGARLAVQALAQPHWQPQPQSADRLANAGAGDRTAGARLRPLSGRELRARRRDDQAVARRGRTGPGGRAGRSGPRRRRPVHRRLRRRRARVALAPAPGRAPPDPRLNSPGAAASTVRSIDEGRAAMFNLMKTAVLMAAITALFMAIGRLIGGNSGMMLALVVALGMNFFSYWFSDKIVLRMYNAQEVDDTTAPQFVGMVRELSQRAGVPMPKVYLIDEAAPNAFATGRNPEHAAVAATTGIIRALSERELRGVMSHELAHVRHRDILISTISAPMAGAIGMLAT